MTADDARASMLRSSERIRSIVLDNSTPLLLRVRLKAEFAALLDAVNALSDAQRPPKVLPFRHESPEDVVEEGGVPITVYPPEDMA